MNASGGEGDSFSGSVQSKCWVDAASARRASRPRVSGIRVTAHLAYPHPRPRERLGWEQNPCNTPVEAWSGKAMPCRDHHHLPRPPGRVWGVAERKRKWGDPGRQVVKLLLQWLKSELCGQDCKALPSTPGVCRGGGGGDQVVVACSEFRLALSFVFSHFQALILPPLSS